MKENGPKHVAIIMDGNGRWAKKKGLVRSMGHERGGNQVREILRAAFDLHMDQLTLYAFSTENWKRPKAEVSFLQNLLVKFLKSETKQLNEDNVRLKVIGDTTAFNKKVQKQLEDSKEALQDNDGIVLCLALNYGSRHEILRACKNFALQAQENPGHIEELNEEIFSDYLYTKGMPEVDLLIRTAGEQRLSNYLLWQLSYAELYFVDVFWPDFTPDHLQEAAENFINRDRRFGGL
ncbi:MAG: isoprenyl transferase [Planctomycetes bacterium]|nr:isoprenyl transferase [Planctomycetota bacterium]